MIRTLRLQLALASCLLLHARPAQAEEAKHHSLSLDVRPIASGGATKTVGSFNRSNGTTTAGTKMHTDTTSSVRTHRNSVGLELTVRNLASQGDEAKLEWYFYARPVDNSAEFLHDMGTQTVVVGAANEQKITVESKETKMTVSRSVAAKYGTSSAGTISETKGGLKNAGWIVRLVADGTVLAVRASTPSLEAKGRNTADLTK